MNYNKVIKDLKERNDKLENQRRQFELKLYHEQYIVEQKDKEIQRLHKELDYANNDNIYYIAKIDKANDYIKQHSNNFVECLYVEEVEELSKIL